ncbi:hypothetical protein Ahia01_000949200 [Argonauta hians]
MFVLDTSSSVWVQDYRKQLKFVSKLADSFEIGPNDVQVGVITYSTRANLDISLNRYKSKKNLKNAILAIPYRSGTTNTANALVLLRREMQKVMATRSGLFIAIIVTDGHSRIPEYTAKEAKRLHDLGVDVYAIGVGKKYSIEELRLLSSNPEDNVYEVTDYEALENLAQRLDIKTCNETVYFGYDLLSIGILRSNMLNRFIWNLLPYTTYGSFQIVTLPYCPNTFDTPLTVLQAGKVPTTTDFSPKNFATFDGVVARISKEIQSKLNGHTNSSFSTVLYVEDSPLVNNVITRNTTLEITKVRNISDKVFIVTIGSVSSKQIEILRSLNCEIIQVPSYEYLVNRVQTAPFYFRPLMNRPMNGM